MPRADAERWNEKYRNERALWLDMEPRLLLEQFKSQIPHKGIALDVACGVGTNAIYLAALGLNVIGIDISEYALQLAIGKTLKLGYPVQFAVADITNLWLPENYFNLITNFHFLERAAIPVLKRALKPGGTILFETFVSTKRTNAAPAYYLNPGELKSIFEKFSIIHYAEFTHKHSQNHGERGTAQIVARKTDR
jgi:tellurite methyltransferase